jgi:hypothetical protein
VGKRRKISRKVSNRIFRKTSGKVNKRNLAVHPMRGGFRI